MKRLLYFTIITALIPFLFVSCGEDDASNLSIKGIITDESGNQIPDANIAIRLTEEKSITSEPNGEFQFSNLVAGTYQLTVSAIGYRSHISTINVKTGEVTSADIVLKKGNIASIAGFVRDAQTEKSIPNATVQTIPVTTSSTTEKSGLYEFVDLDSGTYAVRVFALGYSVPEKTVTVERGKTARADFQLAKQESIELSVTPSNLDFGGGSSTKTLTIENLGSDTLTWSITFPPDGWLAVVPTDGNTTDIPSIVSVTVDRVGFPPGNYDSTILIISNGGMKQIPVTMKVQ